MIQTNSRLPRILLIIFLIALSISPAFALGANSRNLLLIGFMAFSPLIVLYYLQFRAEDFLLFVFVFMLIACPMLFHPESMRWSTILYTAMFCITFLGIILLVRNSDFGIKHYLTLIKYLIYAYAVVLLIQQFCVLTGLPIFNVSNYVSLTPWKLNSLTSEPEHSARILGVLMYSYIVIREKSSGIIYSFADCCVKDKWVWLSFLWVMLTAMSSTAFIYLLIICLKFIRIRTFLIAAIVGIIAFITIDSLEIKSFERFKNVLAAVITLDENNIVAADHSASFRIVPMMRYTKMVDITSTDTWFGHGVDYIQERFSSMFAGVEKGAMAHGGLMILFIDYGLVPFILFVVFTLRFSIQRKDIQTYLLWFLMVLSIPINVQLLWFALAFFWINDYFINEKDNPYSLSE